MTLIINALSRTLIWSMARPGRRRVSRPVLKAAA
jgi:hypothetical protein